ncbi:OmpA family protein [Halomonas urumqiensis]|nr:OmpA family protein [Halomonas urumqiensis]GHE20794.1 membrane protein [Halomonas urumqiensis]
MNMRDARGWQAPTIAALMALAVALSGCAGSSSSLVGEGAPDDGFPDIEGNWHGEGKFVDPDAVMRVSRGQNKDQVRQLLDSPHFSEGFFGVREWDYVFNFYTGNVYTGNDREYITCQYKVVFDDEMRVDETRWRTPQCPALLVPIEVEKLNEREERVQQLTLASDVLFSFNSDELELEGRRALDRVAEILDRDFDQPSISVMGHTDRLGDDDYNLGLSRSRAQVVSAYLVAQGVEASTITSEGKGDAEPVVECSGVRVTSALTECLQPNRRVDIEVTEGAEPSPP